MKLPIPDRDDIRKLLAARPIEYGTALATWVELQVILKDVLLREWLAGRLKSRDEMNIEAAAKTSGLWAPRLEEFAMTYAERVVDSAWGEVADE